MRTAVPILPGAHEACVDDAQQTTRLGPLRGDVWLQLETREARNLFLGRRPTRNKPGIVGLLGFADRLRVIWQAARDDDPYADWWLIRIHDAIAQASDGVRTRIRFVRTCLSQAPAIQVSIASSRHPYRVPLRFANPQAYRGAALVAEYDRLVRLAFTAQYVGLLESAICRKLIYRGGKNIRATFASAQGFRVLGIDRACFRAGSGESARAVQLMGDVPKDVLSGTRRAPIAPRRVRGPAGLSYPAKLHTETDTSTPLAKENNDA